MLSKEEIEEALNYFRKFTEYTRNRALEEYKCENKNVQYAKDLERRTKIFEILIQQIEQLEEEKQKLIEKLEEDIKYGKEFESDLEPTIPEIRAEYAQEILETLKGENNNV